MSDSIFAIDPGTEESAYVILNEGAISAFGKLPNQALLLNFFAEQKPALDLVIEQVACYGMAVGAEVFETVFWSGRFAQAWGWAFHRLKRADVKMHLCQSMRAKDANIRQALIDRFGAPGTKKNPGATYGISGDVWAALGVAVTFYDKAK